MPVASPVAEPEAALRRPVEPEVPSVDAPVGRSTSGRRGRGPLAAMAGGLVVVALAGGVLVRAADRPVSKPPAAPVAAAAPGDPLAITLSARDVSVVTQVYEPGQESGWHTHAGIHAVAVLSGTLTVYDGQCQAQTVEPGKPYVGGQQLHLVRNETDAPVHMTVTYLNPTANTTPTQHLPAPAGCPVGA